MVEQPIRVAHVVGKMVGGGVESFIMNYYREIDKTKVQFDFIIDEDSTVIPKKEIEEMGGNIIIVPPYQKIFKYIKKMRQVLKKNNYSIIHSHINTLSIFPLFVAWLEKIPVRIAHSHATSNIKEWKRNIIKYILKPFSKVFATNYFACSEYAGRWLFGDKTFDNNEVLILNNAIDIKKFVYNSEVRKKIRKELSIKDDMFVLGHVGRIVKTKNHKFLIEMLKNIKIELKEQEKTVKLLLIGDGPLVKELKELINNYNLENDVIFLGVKNNIEDYLNAMDLFVFPSLYEGFGMSLVEAQVSGLNCIASSYVTTESNILDKVKYVDLNNCSKWIDIIKTEFNTDSCRMVNVNDINSFDIKHEVCRLQKIYLKLFKESENDNAKSFCNYGDI